MDELLNSKCENPSERISAWIKEIKTYGFHSLAFESNTIDTINNENKKSENENEVEGFVVQDLFCKIDEYLLVASKKLLKTVTIGIATIIDIKKELKYQIFIPFKFITSLL